MAIPGMTGRKKPAILRVRSPERAQEVLALCNEKGVKAIVGIEPDKSEDISDLDRKLYPATVARAEPKSGRNDPCPCGSGKKYKKCCYAN